MSTWKQDIANETIPIDGVNDISAVLTWNIGPLEVDSARPLESVSSSLSAPIKAASFSPIDRRLIDGKNYVSGDHVIQIAYLKYIAARNGVSGLEQSRPLSNGYGLKIGIDTLSIGGNVWTICGLSADGFMNDEATGVPEPSKLKLTLRK